MEGGRKVVGGGCYKVGEWGVVKVVGGGLYEGGE